MEGLPLVLIPGMMCDHRLFQGQLPRIKKEASVYLPYIGDHRSIKLLAHEILAKSPTRFALAGLSMGGIVAMEILSQAPERVERLALLSTNPLSEREEKKKLRDAQIQRVRDGRLKEVMESELIPLYTENQEIRDLCLEMAIHCGEEVFINQSLALQNRPDYQKVLKATTIPTLVLCGEGDQLCTPEVHKLMHELILSSQLMIIKKSNHLTTLEQPEIVTDILLHWLRDQEKTTQTHPLKKDTPQRR